MGLLALRPYLHSTVSSWLSAEPGATFGSTWSVGKSLNDGTTWSSTSDAQGFTVNWPMQEPPDLIYKLLSTKHGALIVYRTATDATKSSVMQSFSGTTWGLINPLSGGLWPNYPLSATYYKDEVLFYAHQDKFVISTNDYGGYLTFPARWTSDDGYFWTCDNLGTYPTANVRSVWHFQNKVYGFTENSTNVYEATTYNRWSQSSIHLHKPTESGYQVLQTGLRTDGTTLIQVGFSNSGNLAIWHTSASSPASTGNWTPSLVPSISILDIITVDYSVDRFFVAVRDMTATEFVFVSLDGITWTEETISATTENDYGKFKYRVGLNYGYWNPNDASFYKSGAYFSHDGSTWVKPKSSANLSPAPSAISTPVPSNSFPTFSPPTYILDGQTGIPFFSVDGQRFVLGPSNIYDQTNLYAFGFSSFPGLYTAQLDSQTANSSHLAYSADALTWTNAYDGTVGLYYDTIVQLNGTEYRFEYDGIGTYTQGHTGWSGRFLTSTTGMSWNQTDVGVPVVDINGQSNLYNSYSNTFTTFGSTLIIGWAQNNWDLFTILYSTNAGATWTANYHYVDLVAAQGEGPAKNFLISAVFNGKFYVCANDMAYGSSDLINMDAAFNMVKADTTPFLPSKLVPFKNRVFAVDNNETGIFVSDDFITWTPVAFPNMPNFTNGLFRIVNEPNQRLTINFDFYATVSTTDGINWTSVVMLPNSSNGPITYKL